MRRNGDRWWREAQSDLAAARDSLKTGRHTWCCFQAQQAAEKGLKACLMAKGRSAVITHLLVELVLQCVRYDRSFPNIRNEAKELDRFYIPTRTPDGLAGNLTPSEYFTESDARDALRWCESILTVCRRFVERFGRS